MSPHWYGVLAKLRQSLDSGLITYQKLLSRGASMTWANLFEVLLDSTSRHFIHVLENPLKEHLLLFVEHHKASIHPILLRSFFLSLDPELHQRFLLSQLPPDPLSPTSAKRERSPTTSLPEVEPPFKVRRTPKPISTDTELSLDTDIERENGDPSAPSLPGNPITADDVRSRLARATNTPGEEDTAFVDFFCRYLQVFLLSQSTCTRDVQLLLRDCHAHLNSLSVATVTVFFKILTTTPVKSILSVYMRIAMKEGAPSTFLRAIVEIGLWREELGLMIAGVVGSSTPNTFPAGDVVNMAKFVGNHAPCKSSSGASVILRLAGYIQQATADEEHIVEFKRVAEKFCEKNTSFLSKSIKQVLE